MIDRWRPRSRVDEKQYKVGYRKPPKHSRFKRGQSGNPKGRPKGTRNFKTDVKATLKAPVKVTRDGNPRKVSTQEAMLLRLREKALGGDSRALDRLIMLAQAYNDDELAASDVLSADDANVLRIYNDRVLRGTIQEPAPVDNSAESASNANLGGASSLVETPKRRLKTDLTDNNADADDEDGR